MSRMTLHHGDTVVFVSRAGQVRKGTLQLRPHGRRLWAAIRTTKDHRVHVVPKSKILAVNPVELKLEHGV